jgi:prepilin peptidase CpaA
MNMFQMVAVAITGAAVGWDLATRRIPNVLTFGAALAAVLVHGYVDGWSGAGMALVGWVAGAAFFFPFFALGGMGAGDVKLLAAVGAWLGPVAVMWVALFAGIAGGAMALVVAAFSGYLGKAFSNLFALLMFWRIEGLKPAPELTLSSHSGPRLAYAVPVLAGLVLTLWLR